jgi:hypothetical protein
MEGPARYRRAFDWALNIEDKDDTTIALRALVGLSGSEMPEVLEDYLIVSRKRRQNRLAIAKLQVHLVDELLTIEATTKHYSLAPTMGRYWPIDQIANDNSYAKAMAEDATLAGNGVGAINGFGSQALSLLDEMAGCGGAIANWCNLFTTTYTLLNVQNMPLELQEISISDPTNQTCPGSTCGFPPNGVSGDMRIWLPFAVGKNATVFEIYYADLGLAFDPNYCTSSGTCYYPQYVTTNNEWIYYSAGNGGSLATGVGQGSSCNPPVVTTSGGAGDCSYAAALIAAHGYH